jgi:hypothetical protein
MCVHVFADMAVDPDFPNTTPFPIYGCPDEFIPNTKPDTAPAVFARLIRYWYEVTDVKYTHPSIVKEPVDKLKPDDAVVVFSNTLDPLK